MIYSYGITQQGTYHVKNGIVCQDAHRIVCCGEKLVIAAVADGLGSAEHSDVASIIAVEKATEYCAERIHIGNSEGEILKTIHDAFNLALNCIEKIAVENDNDIVEYDTTLTLAVLIDSYLYYGHSGDSGIIALNTKGLYEKVTEQQRDDEGRVFPLFFGDDKWVFGKYTEPVGSVLLATDGILETLFPIYIRNEPINMHIALARYFMDRNTLQIEELGIAAVKDRIAEFLSGIPDTQVNDDKTLVVLVNTDIEPTLQPDEYYQEPDWAELRKRREEAWRREAYPHLFKND